MRRFAWLGIVMVVAGCGVLGDDSDAVRYVAIADAPQTPAAVPPTADASTGTWRVDCGRNERGIRNSDNLVVNPGVVGAAHHLHDYVGNVSTTAFSTDRSLAAAATTCKGGDKSSYYWPVVRVPGDDDMSGMSSAEHDAHGNEGRVLPPASVSIEFRGSPVSDVVPMPEFLRTATGNAHGFSQGGKHTDHLQWTCSGARDRVAKDYPRCPDGQQVIRVFDFPSCWNGKSLDSPDHSSHLVFPNAAGGCPPGFFPVPQLHLEIGYDVPKGADYSVDTFPEDGRSALADHSHFINVMQPALMGRLVACLNEDKRCTA
ncbi:DUF1996 domain-containing protein [Kribbella sp. NPDC051770]|uniref:DUF1996 domain-containing protein n=1 Tax=Kribbella sp. NPDC051770 TaxID=3155413 RepID=UPI00341BA30C